MLIQRGESSLEVFSQLVVVFLPALLSQVEPVLFTTGIIPTELVLVGQWALGSHPLHKDAQTIDEWRGKGSFVVYINTR